MWRNFLNSLGLGSAKKSNPPSSSPVRSRVQGYLPVVSPAFPTDSSPESTLHGPVIWPWGHPDAPPNRILQIRLVHLGDQGEVEPVTTEELANLNLAPDQAYRISIANLQDLLQGGACKMVVQPPEAPYTSHLIVQGPWASSMLLHPALHALASAHLGTDEVRVWLADPNLLWIIPYHESTPPEVLYGRWRPQAEKYVEMDLTWIKRGGLSPYWFKLSAAGPIHDSISAASQSR